jgi:hypothetical protein
VPNRLGSATSPYLLQHAENPVDWWEWGPEAFEDPATVAAMNEHFVSRGTASRPSGSCWPRSRRPGGTGPMRYVASPAACASTSNQQAAATVGSMGSDVLDAAVLTLARRFDETAGGFGPVTVPLPAGSRTGGPWPTAWRAPRRRSCFSAPE